MGRNQRAEYMKHHTDYMEVANVEVGSESSSGQAVMVFFRDLEDDEKDGRHWVPMSQVQRITRSPNHADDRITMAKWLVKKLGLDV